MTPDNFPTVNGTIGEIPVNRNLGITVSRWKVCSLRERIEILLTGRVWVCVKGDTMPPTLVTGYRAFEIVQDAN